MRKPSLLYQKYDIDQETIEYALDKNERAHMDYNRENGTVTFIYNVLDMEKEKEYYETIPMTFIIQGPRLVTISNRDNAYVIEKMERYVDAHESLSTFKLLFAGLEMISNAYYPIIERLDKHKDEINRLLRKPRPVRTFMLFLTWKRVWFIWYLRPSKIACCSNISRLT